MGKGWINGGIGVLIFSASLPATRLALVDLDPIFLTFARAALAGAAGGALLLLFRQMMPARSDFLALFIVSIGVVIGFPLLTALALTSVTAGHSIVFTGLLPLMTAIFAVIRAGERPSALFWLFSCLGSTIVAGFAIDQGGLDFSRADLLMAAAIILCGLGYAEGAKLSRRLGGWQVISWALVFSLPLTAPLALILFPANSGSVGAPAWAGLAYVALFSMLIGFIFWYRGLAQGGIAAVGQLQLAQPLLGLGFAALLLGEAITPVMIAATVGVVLCVAGAKKFAA